MRIVNDGPSRERAIQGLPAGGHHEPAIFDTATTYYAEGVEEEDGVRLLRFFHILLKRRWVAIGALAVCVVGGIVATLLMTPMYRATAVIQIDREAVKVVKSEGVEPREAGGDEFFQTQYGLLKSRSLAQRVVLRNNLADDRAFLAIADKRGPFKRRGKEAPLTAADRNARVELATNLVMGGLQVNPIRTSRLVQLTYESPDPAVSTKVANAVAETFIEDTYSRRLDQYQYARKLLQDRLEQTRVKLEESERQMVAYERSQQIIELASPSSGSQREAGAPATSQSLTATQLSSLSGAMAQAHNARVAAEQKWRQSQATSGYGLSELLSSPSIQDLRAKRADLSAEYQKNLSTFKPDYPDMVRIKARMDDIDRQLEIEVRAVKDAVQAEYQTALKTEQTLAAQVEQQKSAYLDLRGRSIQYNILQRDVQTNRNQYEDLLERSKEVSVAGAIDATNVSIVDRAQPPGGPYAPRPLYNLIISALVGLLIGGLLALGLEQLDDSIKTPEDVDTKLGLPLLGAIPVLPKGSTALVALADARSPVSEAYYSVRTALQFSTSEGVPPNILVTSARPSEGKSTTATALAQNFARLGLRTLLIDADLRNPSLHKSLGLQNSSGLSNLLTGSLPLAEVVQTTEQPGLLFVACGPLPPNPAELLAGARVRAMLQEVDSQFDQVIIDGPPVMGLADAPLLSSVASGTLLVIAANSTRRGLARAAMKRLQLSRARLLGAVLTKFDARKTSYGYGYGSNYGYAYDYGASHEEVPRLGSGNNWFGQRKARNS